MATLDSLKKTLKEKAEATSSSRRQLSSKQYSDGFDILLRAEWKTYQDFIVPQLSRLLESRFDSRNSLSVLEIGPGPKSVLGYLPSHLRKKFGKYTAFEPNEVFARRLEKWLYSTPTQVSPLHGLANPPTIHRTPFVVRNSTENSASARDNDEKYDIILFCHSMYGMKPKHKFIEQTLEMLVNQPQEGIVVVFHRDSLHIDGLVCQESICYPTGVVDVPDDDEVLDHFAPFVAGFIPDSATLQANWRELCHTSGRREKDNPDRLLFSSPNAMMTFAHHATTLPKLSAKVPLEKDKKVKNWKARLHHPASIFRPTNFQQVQQCVQWALKHKTSLTVIGGSHSGHCIWPNVVSIDMSAFNRVHIFKEEESDFNTDSSYFIIAEAGCKTEDIIRKAMDANLTVPLGSRPSVGAGLWLQGGIGHLARQYGLSSDSIIGAVVVSVDSSQILCVGRVPSQSFPVGAVRPKNEAEILWAMKGAGTNFGVVLSVTFKSYPAPTYCIRNWVTPLQNNLEARLQLKIFDEIASNLSQNFCADAYLYWDSNQMQLGMTMIESPSSELPLEGSSFFSLLPGMGSHPKIVDSVSLFDTEMYISGMHGGHGGGKTSSFKRCLFLKNIASVNIADILITAVETRPTPLCYLHLLQGGGAIGDLAPDATAFGCRDWDFACVITGAWPRDQDGNEASRDAVKWVYKVVEKLLPSSSGVYGADLGPDPRDSTLATKAFGPNQPRLARLKHSLDPHNVLAYACPLQLPNEIKLKLVILVTGDSGVGKNFCADIWVSVFDKSHLARAVSISDATKREYSAATGANLNSLLFDRAYKESHRPELTAFFKNQVQQRPQLPHEHFLSLIRDADADVLFITGMRDKAPVTDLSDLVPGIKLLDVRVKASKETRQARRGFDGNDENSEDMDYSPSIVFENDKLGDEAAKGFAECHLLPFVHENLRRLANMVRRVPDFPRPGIDFRHVLGISQQPGGLALCISLLETQFIGDWTKVDAVASCEAGGFVYASALASKVDVPLALVREAGKLPQPTVSVPKPSSHISSLTSDNQKGKGIEMENDLVPKGGSVVVVDDVLSTGETLCAVLQLLVEAGISVDNVTIMVVAEFPVKRGRDLLRQRGFGRVNVQSLLIFTGT